MTPKNTHDCDIYKIDYWDGLFIFRMKNLSPEVAGQAIMLGLPVTRVDHEWWGTTADQANAIQSIAKEYAKTRGLQLQTRYVHPERNGEIQNSGKTVPYPTFSALQGARVALGLEPFVRDLDILITIQRKARIRVHGDSPITRDQVLTYTIAMIDEMMELIREIGWKPWKKPSPLNRDRLLAELADVIAFFGTWLDMIQVMIDADTAEIFGEYLKKAEINMRRFNGQVDGYGVQQVPSRMTIREDPRAVEGMRFVTHG